MNPFGSHKIARQLTEEIRAGRIALGGKLPTREALMRRFGVARATVDRAVQTLVQHGVVETRRGAGSVVVSQLASRRVGVFGSLTGLAAWPQQPGLDLIPMHSDRWRKAAEREKLRALDALLWYCPTGAALDSARRLANLLPQIVVNRTPSELDFVSTDHAGAIQAITRERLTAQPGGLPVFLGLEPTHDVIELRREGFVRACRECRVFYEMLNLPQAFDGKLAELADRLDNRHNGPLVIVSAALQNTGAVMRWVHDHGWRWGRDVFYSDFDNAYSADVWGVRVTSFIQDYTGMVDLALSKLYGRLNGSVDRVQILCPPLRQTGDT